MPLGIRELSIHGPPVGGVNDVLVPAAGELPAAGAAAAAGSAPTAGAAATGAATAGAGFDWVFAAVDSEQAERAVTDIATMNTFRTDMWILPITQRGVSVAEV